MLVCPACLGDLELSAHETRCRSCGALGLRPGERHFAFGAETERNEVVSARQENRAASHGHDHGVTDAPASTGLEGDAWTFFVPGLAGRAVLSIEAVSVGASLGAAGHRPAHLFALFPDRAMGEAAAAAVAGRREISVVSQSGLQGRLPFSSGVFDVVAVHRLDAVERWAGQLWKDGSALLAEMVRVLRAGGVLYVDGKSTGLFGRVRRLTRAPFSVTRTVLELWRLGLRPLRVLRQREADGRRYKMEAFPRQGSRLADIRWLVGAVVRGGRIALVAGATDATRLDRILDRVPGASSGRQPSFHFGSGGAYRVEADQVVVRLPCDERGMRRCRNGYAALQRLQDLSLSFATPRPVAHGVADDQPFFAESRIPGSEIRYLALSGAQIRRLSSQACHMLTELHVASLRHATLTAALFGRLFEEPLDAVIATGLDAEAALSLKEAESVLRDRLLGRPIQLVRTHGDFKVTNLVQDGSGRAAGVVDWDLSEEPGLPAMDLILYRAFDRLLEFGGPLDRAMLHILEADAGNASEVGVYRERLGIDVDRWKAYGLLALVRYLLNQGDPARASDDGPAAQQRAALVGACRFLVE